MDNNTSYLNELYSVDGQTPYIDVLNSIQQYVSKECKDIFNSNKAFTDDEKFRIKKTIENYITNKSIKCKGFKSIFELSSQIYKDMVLYSFLTDYLDNDKIEEIGLEEININSWECIWIITKKYGKIKLDETFLSASHAKDIIKRILTISNMTVDEAKPTALGYIEKNIRSAVISTPIVDDDVGIVCSIRIVRFSDLTRENLIRFGTATDDMLDFMEMCVNHRISICISGATGSGKTGTAGYQLSTLSNETRIITVEDGSREFNLIKRDENGRVINDVVHLLTRPSANKDLNINQEKLIENLMRQHPDIIGIGEMRSEEAFATIEASRTGHGVITTTHTEGAVDTYERMVLLAKKIAEYSEESLYKMAIEAFPIVIFQKQLKNGQRKIMEIIEGLEFKNGKVEYTTLFAYEIDESSYDGDHVIGEFIHRGKISQKLRKKLLQEQVPKAILDKF